MPRKTVLITGAAQRIGAAVARHLHATGMQIIIHAHTSHQQADALVAELREQRLDSAWAMYADLSNEMACASLINESQKCTGQLDVLINNAACFYPTPLADINSASWEQIMGVNLKAPLFLTQHAHAMLKAQHGCIINISDLYAVRTLPRHIIYNLSQAGLDMLTRALAQELGPEIRVNGIAPGAILWPPDKPKSQRQKLLENTALQRTGTPEDIAKAAHFLITQADYISGHILRVDGASNAYAHY